MKYEEILEELQAAIKGLEINTHDYLAAAKLLLNCKD